MRSIYNFIAKRLPGPGTGNMAFQPSFGLPAFSVGGPGIEYTRPFLSIQEAPLYYDQEQVIDGINGLEYQGMYSQGLIDLEQYVDNLAAQNTAVVGGGVG